jgi:hypothetical protein
MNEFEKAADEIGHGLKVAGEDIAKGVKFVITDGDKLIKVISDAKTLTPEFKAELKTLLDDLKPIAAAMAPVVASGGKDLGADILAIQPVIQDVVRTAKDAFAFLPTLEAAYKELEGDLAQ